VFIYPASAAKHNKRMWNGMWKLQVTSTIMTFGDRSFAVDRPRVWNSLPASIHDPTLSIAVFYNRLKSHLFVHSRNVYNLRTRWK